MCHFVPHRRTAECSSVKGITGVEKDVAQKTEAGKRRKTSSAPLPSSPSGKVNSVT